jgi:hypothetical protein
MPARRKKRPKKRKYKTITFKLTERQKKSLDKYSKARNTTPLKLIKRSIETFTSLQDDAPLPQELTSKNQLDLFIEAEAMEAANGQGVEKKVKGIKEEKGLL